MRRLLPYGPQGCLVEVEDTAAALRLAAWAGTLQLPGVEVVPGARTVLFDGMGPDAVGALLPSSVPQAPAATTDAVEVAVRFDGEDLPEVALAWGCSQAAVIERLLATQFTSAFVGFAPGFAYLTGLPSGLSVPRRATPRPAVPRGSLALAGEWCGIYPTSSPGGWQLVGRTDAVLWDPERAEPALLAPGRRVRFVEA